MKNRRATPLQSDIGPRWTVGFVLAAQLMAFHASAQTQPKDPQATYVIGVGDVLTVSVWRNQELGAKVPVRPDGRISVPLVGELEVAGRTPERVRTDLVTAFSEFVTAPAVSIVVDEINSRKVFVVGEIAQAGVYDILQPTKLMQVLAMAGGLTEYAKKDQVIVLRDRGGRDERLVVSIKAIQSGRQPDDNLVLQPGDTVIVP